MFQNIQQNKLVPTQVIINDSFHRQISAPNIDPENQTRDIIFFERAFNNFSYFFSPIKSTEPVVTAGNCIESIQLQHSLKND